MAIQEHFFNAETYGIYMAARDLLGDKGESLVWRSGAYVFKYIKNDLPDLTDKRPVEVVRIIGDYLVGQGYFSRIDITEIGPNQFYYDMYDAAIVDSIQRLIKDGGVLSHYSTALIFAVLKDVCKMWAELEHTMQPSENPAGNFARETWTLHPL
jgi:hypothetical protein